MAASETLLEGDDLKVAQWRTERFLALGFTAGDADWLALCDTDWHEAAALVAAGCPLKLAVKILT